MVNLELKMNNTIINYINLSMLHSLYIKAKVEVFGSNLCLFSNSLVISECAVSSFMLRSEKQNYY